MTVADQRATQKLLTAALKILMGFYALQGGWSPIWERRSEKRLDDGAP